MFGGEKLCHGGRSQAELEKQPVACVSVLTGVSCSQIGQIGQIGQAFPEILW